mgnify:CR=1 FL=1
MHLVCHAFCRYFFCGHNANDHSLSLLPPVIIISPSSLFHIFSPDSPSLFSTNGLTFSCHFQARVVILPALNITICHFHCVKCCTLSFLLRPKSLIHSFHSLGFFMTELSRKDIEDHHLHNSLSHGDDLSHNSDEDNSSLDDNTPPSPIDTSSIVCKVWP